MTRAIYCNLLLVSFVIMGLEILAVRVVAPSFGSTVYTWGIIISIFLIGSSLGYLAGGHASEKPNGQRLLFVYYLLGLLSAAHVLRLADWLFPLLAPFPSVPATIAGVSALFLAPNVFLGAVVTYVTKIGLDSSFSGKTIGRYHTASAVGSVLGTVATTFWILPNVSLPVALAFLLFLAVSACIALFWHLRIVRRPLLFALFALVSLAFPAGSNEEPGLLYETNSAYHAIRVYNGTEWGGVSGDYRFLAFSNNSTVQSGMDLNQPEALLFPYTQAIADAAEQLVPRSGRVFLIGHGGGSLTQYFEQSGRPIVTAELDPAILRVSQDYFGYSGSSVKVGDGRHLLAQQRDPFDFVIVDAYHNTLSLPFHLVTQEFFHLTREKLTPSGVLAINAIGAPEGDGVLASLLRTIQSAYPFVSVYQTIPSAGVREPQNLLVLASRQPLSAVQLPRLRPININTADGELMQDADTNVLEAH